MVEDSSHGCGVGKSIVTGPITDAAYIMVVWEAESEAGTRDQK